MPFFCASVKAHIALPYSTSYLKYMTSEAKSPDEYLAELPEERKEAVERLRRVIRESLPAGFEETMSYGMIGYVVPFEIYPKGYHVNPELPLPFINLASQKNYIALYHSGIYCDPELEQWFREEYDRRSSRKLDMGKSCIRFKKPDAIPYDLIGELAEKITPAQWIALYEKSVKR